MEIVQINNTLDGINSRLDTAGKKKRHKYKGDHQNKNMKLPKYQTYLNKQE